MSVRVDARAQWDLAVEFGAHGAHAAARAILRRLRSTPDPIVRSLAASTEASLLRQRGLHSAAAPHDGRALLLAHSARGVRGVRGVDGVDGVDGASEAMADALIGLAADSLGSNRVDIASDLLDRCRPVGWRTPVRFHWVRAETALIGEQPGEAMRHAEAAVHLASQSPSARHRTKSDLILAAASMSAGDHEGAAIRVAQVRCQALANGWIPLAWAADMLGAALGLDGAKAGARARAVVLARLGGPLG